MQASLTDRVREGVSVSALSVALTQALAPRDAAAEGRAAAEYLRWLAASLNDSTTARLRERVLGLPFVGALARAAARRLKG